MPHRNRRHLRTLLLPALLVSLSTTLAPSLSALDPKTPLSELQIDTWTPHQGLPNSSVPAIAQDTPGYMWIGTEQGLTRFDGLNFHTLTTKDSRELPSNTISAITPSPDGSLWIGTRYGLALLQNGRLLAPRNTMLQTPINEIELDLDKQRLWIASLSGLAEYDTLTQTVLRRYEQVTKQHELTGHEHRGTTLAILPDDDIHALLMDADGSLWIGTNNSGLLLLRDNRITSISTEPSNIRPLLILALKRHSTHGLLVGTVGQGIWQLRDGVLHRFEPTSQTMLIAFELLTDRDENLWIAGYNQLGRVTREGVADILDPVPLGQAVYALAEDLRGDIWFGTTEGGLSRVRDPRRRQGPSTQGAEAPLPRLEQILVNRSEIPVDANRSPVSGNIDLAFRFSILALRDQEQLLVGCRLQRFEDEWRTLGPRRSVDYTNVPPGPYTFEVAVRRQGEDDEVTLDHTFLVPWPFYRTWPFYIALVALAGFLSRTFYRLRVRRVLQRKRRLEAKVEARKGEILNQTKRLADLQEQREQAHLQLRQANRELKTLNREKTDFLAIATHDLRTPLLNAKGFAGELRVALDEARTVLQPTLDSLPEQDRQEIENILGQELPETMGFIDSAADSMTRLIDPILKLSRFSRCELTFLELDLDTLARSVKLALEPLLEESKARLVLESLPTIQADPAALEEVLRQLLRNALHYLDPHRPGEVRLYGDRGKDTTTIHVRDNGVGISAEQEAKVFRLFGRGGQTSAPGRGMGLAYVRTLIQRHGGHVWYVSQPKRGTTFSFSIPNQPLKPEEHLI